MFKITGSLAVRQDALKNNFNNCSGNNFNMKIGWVKTSGRLTVFLKNQKRYEENGFTTDKLRDGHFYLQSHWGSAVVFTAAKFVL
ncbi:MAG: hypothetical protein FWG73_05300 [Planctomycetaceae bacterium]|nr:hypothetical protein [Planctomycetaceae bacterium]